MRKLMLLVGAVAALTAFAIPAAASAAQLTSPAGTVVPVGTNITATSTNAKTVTKNGTFECARVSAKGNVIKNSGGEVTASNGGVGFDEGCKTSSGVPIRMDDLTLTNLKLVNPTTGTASLTFEATIPTGGSKCHYSGTVAVTYTAGTDTLKLSGNLSGRATDPDPPCAPGANTAAFTGDFKLTKTAGGAIIVD